MFQSPSRWGRCCIRERGLFALVDDEVSVPFSMGTVLHRSALAGAGVGFFSFSPLLDGDGVASMMCHCRRCKHECFSPLLDGDGVASGVARPGRSAACSFQSPSRWGRCCISPEPAPSRRLASVSVPFSMGTVLHLPSPPPARRSCRRFSPLLDGDGVASAILVFVPTFPLCFSPLLDGDGVASPRAERAKIKRSRRFSPLLDGDGVASQIPQRQTLLHRVFQSPSRWGRCCITPMPRWSTLI